MIVTFVFVVLFIVLVAVDRWNIPREIITAVVVEKEKKLLPKSCASNFTEDACAIPCLSFEYVLHIQLSNGGEHCIGVSEDEYNLFSEGQSLKLQFKNGRLLGRIFFMTRDVCFVERAVAGEVLETDFA